MVIVVMIGVAAGTVLGVSRQGSGDEYAMRLRLFPLSSNGTVVALGVSAPQGPIAADFQSSRVLRDLSSMVGGTSPDQLRRELGVAGVEGDPNQMTLAVSASASDPPALLKAWLAAIQADRRTFIAESIDDTRAGYLQDLKRDHLTQLRFQVIANIARLAGLRGSLKTDVVVLRGPVRIPAASQRSPVFYAIAGGMAGVVAGVALALGMGLLDRRLRTPAALSAQFGLPVIADLRAGEGAAAVQRRLRAAERSGARPSPLVIIEAGSPGSASVAARALEGTLDATPTATGEIGSDETQEALRGAGLWIVAVTPGETRADQAAEVSAEFAVLSSRPLGLVLV